MLQNGLCEDRVAAIVGGQRVIGAIVAWGASMPEPGRYERSGCRRLPIGRRSRRRWRRELERVGELLEAIGAVT